MCMDASESELFGQKSCDLDRRDTSRLDERKKEKIRVFFVFPRYLG
jgi:hypothetical protein